jgi:hypothetical protein
VPPGPWTLPPLLARRLAALEEAGEELPALSRPTRGENRLPVVAAVLVAVALQLALPRRLSLPPRELLPVLELVLLAVLTAYNPIRLTRHHPVLRPASIALVALITTANGASAVLLAERLVAGRAGQTAGPLLLAGGAVYLTNVIAFGLWYWEYDRGGPAARQGGHQPFGDFAFPQMQNPELAPPTWEPAFLDYLYLSFTNATAFSPTDVLPLSRWAKVLMAAQSAVALVTVALVVARAVNVLK